MFVKVKDGQIEKFPYTIGQLRKDNPNTSFPKNIPLDTLAEWGVFPVVRDVETYDRSTHVLVWDKTPTYVEVPVKREEDGILVNGTETEWRWKLLYKINAIDPIELAKRAAKLESIKASKVRKARDAMLAKTDWEVLKGLETGNLSKEFKDWRQSLRDLPADSSFPDVTLPVRP